MSVPANEGPAINDGSSGQVDNSPAPVAEGSNESGINPAWNPLLETLPPSLHGMVTPHLSEWDKNVQQMVQKVHSEYEPWKPLREAQLDPNQLSQAWQAIQNLENNPQGFVEAVINHYGLQNMFSPEQGQQPEELQGEEETEFDITQHPDFMRYGQMTEQMAQLLLAQHQQQEDSNMDAQLENDLALAKQKHGDFDEDYVLQRVMYFEEDVDTAAQHYKQFVNNVVSQSRNPSAGAPIIMGSGGGTPAPNDGSQGFKTAEDRKAYVKQFLAQNAQQGG